MNSASYINVNLTSVYETTETTYKFSSEFKNCKEMYSNQLYESQQKQIQMELDEKELWASFSNLVNEMILTKAGRRTFPLIKIKLNGLEESSLYTIQVEFRYADSYKYRFVNGEWRTSTRTEKISSSAILYEHPDSPNFGHHWSKESVAFGKLKLTNNENTRQSDNVFLRSLNKYEPVIHVYRHDKKNVDDKVLVFSKAFKETQFIAVTAYQNEQITSLKIKHNPFAKAFLNNAKPTLTIDSSSITAFNKISTNEVKVNKSEPQQLQLKSVSVKSPAIQHSIENHIYKPANSSPLSSNSSQTQNYQFNYPPQNWYQNAYNNYHQASSHFNFYPCPAKYNFQQSATTPNAYYYQQTFDPFYYQYQQPFNYNYPTSQQQYDNYSTSNGKRPAEEQVQTESKEDEDSLTYSSRPAKRVNLSQTSPNAFMNNLPVSPVNYTSSSSSNQAKFDYNEQSSDDSLNSTDYLNYLNAQSTDSTSSLYYSNKAYLPVKVSTNNESGYYTHSPNSIALALDSVNNPTDSTD